MGFTSKYTGQQIENKLDNVDQKFTADEKEKVSTLQNYDDTTIKQDISDLQTNKANSSDVYSKMEVDSNLEIIKNDIAINKSSLGLQKKNLFSVGGNTQNYTSNGVTFTINNDGTMIVTGTPTERALYEFKSVILPKGKYIISGCPVGGTGETDDGFGLGIFINEYIIQGYDTGVGKKLTCTTTTRVILRIRIGKSCVIPDVGLKFSPMIRYADIQDDTYEPYIDDLQTQITSNDSDISKCKTTLGTECINLFNPNDVNWYDSANITISTNDVITSNITTDNRDNNQYSNAEYKKVLPAGEYSIIYNCTSYTSGTVRICLFIDGEFNSELGIKSVGTQAKTFTLTKKSEIALNFKLWKTSCTLMIKKADISDSTFIPYIPSLQTQINSILERLTALEGGST